MTLASYRKSDHTLVCDHFLNIRARGLASSPAHRCTRCGLTPSGSSDFQVFTPLRCRLAASSGTTTLSRLVVISPGRERVSLPLAGYRQVTVGLCQGRNALLRDDSLMFFNRTPTLLGACFFGGQLPSSIIILYIFCPLSCPCHCLARHCV